ncbi:MAG: hypothetical protein AAF337_06725 [Pseudomonadota bacterium]
MVKTLFASVAAISLFAVSPAFASTSTPIEVAAAPTGVTSEQAGRIVLQGGQAIGTITEVSEEDNLAVIAMMDGSEKQVSLTDLAVTDDGSIELVAMTETEEGGATYE